MAKKSLLKTPGPTPEQEPISPPQATEEGSATDWMEEYDEAEYVQLKNALPPGVNIEDAMAYGFYEFKNRYWVRRSESRWESISNFTIQVKYLIEGANPKRIVDIENIYRRRQTIEMEIEDLISVDKFKAAVERRGNYLFDGKGTDLAKIKQKLFNIERSAIEITRLGQYHDKFFAFANGIFDNETWYTVDDRGMVEHKRQTYYVPVFGSTTAEDDEDLRNYRKFMHQESGILPAEWAQKFYRVYGDNGLVGISFYFFALFSDLIFKITKAAPMLFLFGQRGSGKGTMANSLMALFGTPQDALMLGGASTVVGFMRKLGQFSNALVWLDEYKNDIGEKKIESLKNIWDRVGYERGVKDASNRTQTTSVTSSAILSGQEIPNVEPALFSRTVLLQFINMQRSQDDVEAFDALRRLEDGGITNVTLELLTLRAEIKARFLPMYSEMAAMFRRAMQGRDIIERQIVNYSILCTMYTLIGERISLPVSAADFCKVAEMRMAQQAELMKPSNEVQQFWDMVLYLLARGEIKDGVDIHVKDNLVKIRLVSIVPLYRQHSAQQRIKALDKGTLTNYLQASDAYHAGESKGNHRFPGLENTTTALVFQQTQLEIQHGISFKFLNEKTETPENQQNKTETPF